MPTSVTIWQNRSVSGLSNDETLLGSPDQHSESSNPISPTSSKERTPSSNPASPPKVTATGIIGTSEAEDRKTDTDPDIEQYWIDKDEERLKVIANMNKAMDEIKGQLANTTIAFQMASEANHKLQAELEKKRTTLSQVEGNNDHLVHSLDVADMDKDLLMEELARSRRDTKYQSDRAEEALTLIEADSTKDSIAKLLQAKEEAESCNTLQQEAAESEMDFLKSQLKERCDSVARLTESLSRVADSDRWKEIKTEMEGLNIRAGKLPDELRVALLECENLRGRYGTLWKKHEDLLLEGASSEEKFQKFKEMDLRAMRQLKRDLKDKAARSERALKGCLRQVFERMVRCSLCLESDGFLPFDKEHQAICKQVLRLTGEDYQQALFDYYDEHDICDEFNLGEDNNETEDEAKAFLKIGGYTGNADDEGQAYDKEHGEGLASNPCNVDVHPSNRVAEPADTTHELSHTPTAVTTVDNNVVAAVAKEEEVRESPETQEVRSKLEFPQTGKSPELSHTAADPEEVPESLETSNAKLGSALDPSKDHNLAGLPMVDNTRDFVDTKRLSLRDVDNIYVDDAKYSNKYNNMVDDVDSSDGKESKDTADGEEGPEQVGGVDSSRVGSSKDEEVNGQNSPKFPTDDESPLGDRLGVNHPSTIHQQNAAIPQSEEGGVDVPTATGQPDVANSPVPNRGKSAELRSKYSKLKKPWLSRKNTVSTPTASASSEGFAFPKPSFTSQPAEATDLSIPAGSNDPQIGRPFTFGTGKNPPPSLFATSTSTAASEAKSGKGSFSAEPLRTSKPARAPNASAAGKGNGQDIWKGISFAAAEDKSLSFNAALAADLGATSNEKSPFSKPFVKSLPVEAMTPASKYPEPKKDSEATEAQKEAVPGTTDEAPSPNQLPDFSFGESSGPVFFTGSSSSFPSPFTQPASTEMFSFSGQTPPSMAIRPKGKATEDGIAKNMSPKENLLKTEASMEKMSSREETLKMEILEAPADASSQEKKLRKKKQKKAVLKEGSVPKVDTPKDTPAPSQPSRNQKRAAKGAAKKAAKKAEKEAINAKAEAKRRVQQAMMMRA